MNSVTTFRYLIRVLFCICIHCELFTHFVFGRVFSYLDVPSLCRCARVSKYWNQIALDGSNWQHVDLFSFQTDIEVVHCIDCDEL